MPLPRSRTPAESTIPRLFVGLVDAAPASRTAKASACQLFRGYRAASAPAAYASRMVLPPPMQSSLPAGWLAFTGRASNPLDHNKRFQITHPPFLDLSWRYRDELTPSHLRPPEILRSLSRSKLHWDPHSKASNGTRQRGSPTRLPRRAAGPRARPPSSPRSAVARRRGHATGSPRRRWRAAFPGWSGRGL